MVLAFSGFGRSSKITNINSQIIVVVVKIHSLKKLAKKLP